MPKSYSQYKHKDIENLGLTLKQRLFITAIKEVTPSDFLKTTLEINTKRVQNTEKAKSEFIIAPILFEIARRNVDSISFFSGHNLDVDKTLGLKGFCDFLYTRLPESAFIKAPIFCVAEAKNDNLEKGVPQCIAEMYAARLFNAKDKQSIKIISGCVTTGYQWQFLKLEDNFVYQDSTIYALSDLPKVLGILEEMVTAA
jgi:hypothetical protein